VSAYTVLQLQLCIEQHGISPAQFQLHLACLWGSGEVLKIGFHNQ